MNLVNAEEISGMIESVSPLGLGTLDSEQGVVLKDWTAQDFSNIYVRFRPYLIIHARKLLRDESQAEEVVQDAFLYLMTALPELDSELGVFRFLKWKTKMLCLDLIRSSAKGLNTKLVPLSEEIADETRPHDLLERADDAAIIRMALAKLSPRHREALIATIYEEKSNEEVARHMDLSDNAFRQLLHRARASFRQALVGEAAIEGKTVAEILAVATRRATTTRSIFLVSVLILGLGAVSPMLPGLITPFSSGEIRASEVTRLSQFDFERQARTNIDEPGEDQSLVPGGQESFNQGKVGEVDSGLPAKLDSQTPDSLDENLKRESPPGGESQIQLVTEAPDPAREAFRSALDGTFATILSSQRLDVSHVPGTLIARDGSGLTVNVAFDADTENVIQYLVVEFEANGVVWKAVPTNSLSVVESNEGWKLVSYAATDFLIGDFSGAFDFVSISESVFSRSGIKLDLIIDGRGQVADATVDFLPKA